MTLEKSLQRVDQMLLEVSESSVSLLTETSRHIFASGGKRLRPQLVLLAFEATGGQDTEGVIPLAVAVEVIHTATLVHDDINDDGTLRRGRETVNSRWGRTFALLTGDYMFTKVYELMAPFSSELNMILAKAANELVEGETLQIQASKNGTLNREVYYDIIARKTASLFRASAALGATYAQAPAEWVQAVENYAFNLGLAFQIIDDVLDLVGDPEQVGKNTGIDVIQGRGLAVAVDGGAAVAAAPDIAKLREGILGDRSVEEAVAKGRAYAQTLAQNAIDHLDVLPDSPARKTLIDLAHRVINRDH